MFVLEAQSASSFSYIGKLTAGDSISYNMVLDNTNNHDIKCNLITLISPDGEGINITYSSDDFTIKAKSTYTLTVHVNTSWALMENIYIITTSISTESLGSYSSVKIVSGSTDTEPEVEPDPDPEEEPEQPDDTEYDNIVITINGPIPLWPGILAAIVAFIIMLIVLFTRRKDKKEKK